MSALSMSNAVGILPKLLGNLEHVLRKAEANAAERGIDADVFLNARLAPDMWPLAKQVQTVAEFSKNVPYRIAGTESPNYEGHPASFEDCYGVIQKAKADIAKISADDLNGKESREFTIRLNPSGDVPFTGISYLSGFALPNIYFHLTTVYNILRANGVPLKKYDFFGGGS